METLSGLNWPPSPPGMVILAVMPADGAAALRAERLEPPFERLKALHTPKRPPRPGDWLADF